MTAPVAFFVPDHLVIVRTLRMKLLDVLDNETLHLKDAQDWEDFKQRLGRVQGIETALRILTETEQDMRN